MAKLRNTYHFANPGVHRANGVPVTGDNIRTRYNDFHLAEALQFTHLDSDAQRKHQDHLFRLLNVHVSETDVDLFDVMCTTCHEATNHKGPSVLYGLAYDTIAARTNPDDDDLRTQVARLATDSGWERMQCTDIDVFYQRQLASQRPVVLEWWDENNARAVWLDGVKRVGDEIAEQNGCGLVYSMAFVFDLNLAREGGAR